MYLARIFAASAASAAATSESVIILATAGAGSTESQSAGSGKFEQLGGGLCDPFPNIFFRRLRNPLDSLAACGGRRSVISMMGGDKGLRWVIHEACRKPEPKGIYRTP